MSKHFYNPKDNTDTLVLSPERRRAAFEHFERAHFNNSEAHRTGTNDRWPEVKHHYETMLAALVAHEEPNTEHWTRAEVLGQLDFVAQSMPGTPVANIAAATKRHIESFAYKPIGPMDGKMKIQDPMDRANVADPIPGIKEPRPRKQDPIEKAKNNDPKPEDGNVIVRNQAVS